MAKQTPTTEERVIALVDFEDAQSRTSFKRGDVVPWLRARAEHYATLGIVRIETIDLKAEAKAKAEAEAAEAARIEEEERLKAEAKAKAKAEEEAKAKANGLPDTN